MESLIEFLLSLLNYRSAKREQANAGEPTPRQKLIGNIFAVIMMIAAVAFIIYAIHLARTGG